MNDINPTEYTDALRIVGFAMMVIGVVVLTYIVTLAFKKKQESSK